MNKAAIKLSDILILQPKSKIKAGEGKNTGKYKFFTSSNSQNKFFDDYQYDKPALIFGTGGNASIHFCEEKFATSTDCLVFFAEEKRLLKFIYLYLSGNMQILENGFKGAGLKHISKQYILNISLSIPEANEQLKIASVLDKVSDLIDKRHQQLNKLDEMVKARFVNEFYNTVDIVNWPNITMADISINMRTGPFGSALHHNEFVESGIFVLGIDNAVENKFSYNRMRYITEEKYEQLKRYTVRPGDVIITIMGTVGRSAVIPDDIPKAINTKHLACLTIDRSQAHPIFVCCAFQMHPEIRKQLAKQAKGAIMDGLNLSIIKKLCFNLPPIKAQNAFVDFFNLIEKERETINRSLEKLETLKKALMQEYFDKEGGSIVI